MMSSDKRLSPAAGRRPVPGPNGATPPWRRSGTGPIDGPQWMLEHWGDEYTEDEPAFQFVRIEDMAYDRRPGMENVVYLVDSGRGPRQGRPGGRQVDERPRLEDGARQERPDEGHLAVDLHRRRRQPGQDAERDPPAGQHRVDAAGPADHRGSRVEPAVRCRPTPDATTARIMRYTFATDRRRTRRRGEGRPVARREPGGSGRPERQGRRASPGCSEPGSRAASSTPHRTSGWARSS